MLSQLLVDRDWLEKHKSLAGHIKAISHILRVTDLDKYAGGFEAELVITLSMLVVDQAFLRPSRKAVINSCKKVD